MSDINELAQVISTVGFPIACCGYLLWQNGKQDNYHREEQAKLRECIEQNTQTIAKLAEKIDEILR